MNLERLLGSLRHLAIGGGMCQFEDVCTAARAGNHTRVNMEMSIGTCCSHSFCFLTCCMRGRCLRLVLCGRYDYNGALCIHAVVTCLYSRFALLT